MKQGSSDDVTGTLGPYFYEGKRLKKFLRQQVKQPFSSMTHQENWQQSILH
jgi:hypothetical protein